jgi:hypothetical protein
VPLGLLVQFVPKNETLTLKTWYKRCHAAWKAVARVSKGVGGDDDAGICLGV